MRSNKRTASAFIVFKVSQSVGGIVAFLVELSFAGFVRLLPLGEKPLVKPLPLKIATILFIKSGL